MQISAGAAAVGFVLFEYFSTRLLWPSESNRLVTTTDTDTCKRIHISGGLSTATAPLNTSFPTAINALDKIL